MTLQDADFMLELKNYEETRQFAIASHEEIKKDDHYKWLEKNLQYFQVIIDHLDRDVGAVRIQDDEISIWVDRKFRKQGIATRALRDISDWGMTAKIVNGNVSSMRAFIAAEFSPIKYVDNYYILQK